MTNDNKEQELEAKIAELEKCNYEDEKLNGYLEGHIYMIKEILSNSVVLPVEKSWNFFYSIVDGVDTKSFYPNGVIIEKE